MLKKIDDIADRHLCCGCGACSFVYDYKMIDKQNHGKRPVSKLVDKHIPDAQDLYFCPGAGSDKRTLSKTKHQSKKSFNEWGPIIGVYSGYAADSDLRFNASSGGVITALSTFMLKQKMVDGVLQTEANPEKPYLNRTVYNTEVTQVKNASGSRYSPASPCDGLNHVMNHNKSVVIGKPCDINSIFSLCSKNDTLKEKIALKLSIFCAGVPSTEGTLQMLNEMGVENVDDIVSVRYRGRGWPGQAVALSKDKNIKYKSLDYSDSWGKILVRFKQWRCKVCVDHTGQFADIAVGDSWNVVPTESDSGNSMIICRTAKGLEILKAAETAGDIVLTERTVEDLKLSQKNLLIAKGEVWGRLTSLKMAGVYKPKFLGYNLFSFWVRYTPFLRKISSFYGTFKRIKKHKLREPEDKNILRSHD